MNGKMVDGRRGHAALRPMQPMVEEGDATIFSDAPKWVLVVDDEQSILDSVADFVGSLSQSPPFQVRTALSGPEALELMARHFFDLIITDFRMREMDGVRFLEVARQIEPDVPCLLLSADPAGALERLATVEEANVLFLAKPFDPADLASHIMDALGASRPVAGRQMVTAKPKSRLAASPEASEDGDLRHTRGLGRGSSGAPPPA